MFLYILQQEQDQRGIASGISMTMMSIFKTISPAVAGSL